MAISWTFLVTVLFFTCVVNAKTIFERVDDVNDENSRIAKFRAPEDDEALERRGVAQCGCETGNTNWGNCHPQTCPARSITINLKGQYVHPPTVSVAVAYLDIDKNYNTRIRSYVSDVTTTSFKLHYNTWSDSAVYGVELAWTACA